MRSPERVPGPASEKVLGCKRGGEERPSSVSPTCLRELLGSSVDVNMRRYPPRVRGLLGVKNRKPHSIRQKGNKHLVTLEGGRVRAEAGTAGSDARPGPGLACVHCLPTTLSLTFVEAVLVHVSIDVEVLPRREGQLGLRVLIWPVEGVVTRERNKTHSVMLWMETNPSPSLAELGASSLLSPGHFRPTRWFGARGWSVH